ncbi:hypothetical protein [Candidatus Sulfurimonas baltica]|uniref:Uncharacterized protein n=1 Tax=Candidatus Sulfurimonas baltica TaxID=2740404 RepID=A0A7S7LTE2_9BACT|nr:hypothetical protein [Candidatus Sulfurimonas baltica]QOY51151.1 hypothetical protein HUE88_08365 [Candidatus Sulfurimonas baltica]
MDSKEDMEVHHNNLLYYNQMLDNNHTIKENVVVQKKGSSSFSSQKVDFSSYMASPEGYEMVVYPLYFLFIPYVVGALFIFLFIASGNFSVFQQLDMSAFLIVWMIGYEIVATALLVGILVNFLKYDDNQNKRRNF